MMQIQPFNTEDANVRSNVKHIMFVAPVKHLTDDEVLSTLRLIQLQSLLSEGRFNQIVIHRNDKRLELCDDMDRFLAMLIDCHLREVLLTTKRCRMLFGNTVYHWRKIARKCPLTDVASAISECSSGYFGRGWILAPNICTLRKWIITNSNNPEIRNLKL